MREEILKRLFEEIESSGLSYTKIAKDCNISVVMLSQYKNLHKLPSLETFVRICNCIGASADYILGLKDF